jgi:hypothetical protein
LSENPVCGKCFSDPKRAIFCEIKEIEGLSGGVREYAAQSSPLIDADIAKKCPFRAEN